MGTGEKSCRKDPLFMEFHAILVRNITILGIWKIIAQEYPMFYESKGHKLQLFLYIPIAVMGNPCEAREKS